MRNENGTVVRPALEVRLMEIRDHVGRGLWLRADKRTKQYKVRVRAHEVIAEHIVAMRDARLEAEREGQVHEVSTPEKNAATEQLLAYVELAHDADAAEILARPWSIRDCVQREEYNGGRYSDVITLTFGNRAPVDLTIEDAIALADEINQLASR